jgi:hypothetical protein
MTGSTPIVVPVMIFNPTPNGIGPMYDNLQQPNILETIWLLVQTLFLLLIQLWTLGFHWILWIAWGAWWLGAVNAKKTRYVLQSGGWAPAVLLIIVSALVWSRLDARACDCLGFVTLPNFWWQLGYCCMLAAIALFCGWLQSVLHWTPHEINLDPQAHGHGHHGHDHH